MFYIVILIKARDNKLLFYNGMACSVILWFYHLCLCPNLAATAHRTGTKSSFLPQKILDVITKNIKTYFQIFHGLLSCYRDSVILHKITRICSFKIPFETPNTRWLLIWGVRGTFVVASDWIINLIFKGYHKHIILIIYLSFLCLISV